ncbi:hypothetical protein Nepgr_031766 [Nepenthes gracilis]|uniref:Uncharacterized protein n=1 Tax=Nepenthes gracilis TaxID=150966 RepID=A0AAD3Y5E3_NEPGR|nr:hypothetical protein Nepgr_031766 [Nepenthes gracilis]
MLVVLLFIADPARMSLGSWWLNCYVKLLTAAGMVQCLILDAVLFWMTWMLDHIGAAIRFAQGQMPARYELPISIAVTSDCIKRNVIGSFIPVLELSCRSRIVIGFGLLAVAGSVLGGNTGYAPLELVLWFVGGYGNPGASLGLAGTEQSCSPLWLISVEVGGYCRLVGSNCMCPQLVRLASIKFAAVDCCCSQLKCSS